MRFEKFLAEYVSFHEGGEPGCSGWEDRPRTGNEPGYPSTPLWVRDLRIDQDQFQSSSGNSDPIGEHTQQGLTLIGSILLNGGSPS